MKNIITATVLVTIFLFSNAYAQDNLFKLQQKVDSLEVRLDIFQKQQLANNPYSNGDTLKWGTGFFLGGKSGSHYSLNLEAGYMWKTDDDPGMSLSTDYIGKRSDYRYGVGGGVHYFADEPVFKDDVTFYKSTAYGFFGKFNFASPVLLNFISFSCHLKGMYTIPTSDNDHNFRDKRMAYGYGYDIEFWVTEDECATLGFTDESDNAFEENDDDMIYPSKIRFVFGFKTFF